MTCKQLERKQVNNKILILGVDALDPRVTNHYLEEGKLPNIQKLLDRGAANENLEMIGGHPTGTPPMWTTLATGCYANVHGITCFHNPSDKGPEYVSYALDSRKWSGRTIMERIRGKWDEDLGVALAGFVLAANQRQPIAACRRRYSARRREYRDGHCGARFLCSRQYGGTRFSVQSQRCFGRGSPLVRSEIWKWKAKKKSKARSA